MARRAPMNEATEPRKAASKVSRSPGLHVGTRLLLPPLRTMRGTVPSGRACGVKLEPAPPIERPWAVGVGTGRVTCRRRLRRAGAPYVRARRPYCSSHQSGPRTARTRRASLPATWPSTCNRKGASCHIVSLSPRGRGPHHPHPLPRWPRNHRILMKGVQSRIRRPAPIRH